jgi:hypothetical protein
MPSPVPTPAPSSTPAPTTVSIPADSSKDPNILVYFNGERLQFEDAQPVLKDGRTLVPFRKQFETLGFKLKWVDTGDVQKAIGTKGDLAIELTINSTNAKVNGEDVTPDVPAQIIDERTMVPLRFVSESSGFKVSFSSEGNVWTIQIDEGDVVTGPAQTPAPTPVPTQTPAQTPDRSTEEVEPYVVKGHVRNEKGQPLPGAIIYADNQLLYNSNIVVTADENGYYRIELPQLATSWNMSEDVNRDYKGKRAYLTYC